MRTLAVFIALAACWCSAAAQTAASAPAESRNTAPPPDIQKRIDELSANDYKVREAATNELIAAGADWVPQLRAAHDESRDAEVRLRLRFVLDNVSPPSEAILVLRDSDDKQLRAGDLITHLDGRRVRDALGLYSRLQETDVGAMLRIRREAAPLEVGPIARMNLPRLANYRLPHGATIRRALQLYRDGFAEQAWELLAPLNNVDEGELPIGLRAIIAYTAGDAAKARELFPYDAMMPPEGRVFWTNPSGLDLVGPLQAPYQFEFWWFEGGGPPNNHEPDMLVQRVLIPSNQYLAALKAAAELWWTNFRLQLFHDNDEIDRKGGNMIALVAWMLWALDLQSECIQLIEPRSILLGSKWVRVQADAWPELLAGNPAAALDRFWDDARVILDDPQTRRERTALTRNANVAATIALFLYQAPDDPRVQQMLETVAHPEFRARREYLDWMMFGLNARNEERIRQDLARLLPQMRGEDAQQVAWALAVLCYVSETFDTALMDSARERVADSADPAFRAALLPQIDAMIALRTGRLDDALAHLKDARAPGAAQLRSVADFLKLQAATKEQGSPALDALAAVRLGAGADEWIVLTRDRRWTRHNASTRSSAPLDTPSEDWFPGVANWPWLGRDDGAGRAWAYDRRRVIELGREPTLSLRMNIEASDIAAFDERVSPVFDAFADAVTATPISAAERGEFLRDEIKAYSTYVADPNLHELAVVETYQEAGILHLAVRGGPQMLVRLTNKHFWTANSIGEQLGMERPPTFFVHEAPGSATPLLFLMTDQGLVRFDVNQERFSRVPLTGESPFPSIVPESCPYVRRDPRWVYCARLPEDGGNVYRVEVETGAVKALDMINHALPESMYRLRTRDRLRADVEAIVQGLGVPSLATFIRETRETVRAAPAGATH